MTDLVSIIIPIYNSGQFLKESLDSIIRQTYSNIEIICVDDGSTDDSPEILKLYSDKITIISQKNQGLASALNVGIKQMRGKWLKWFSPDDILYPNAIENLVSAAKNLPENTIIYSNWDIIDNSGKKLRSFHESNYNKLDPFDYNVRLLDGQQINVNTTLIPSSLFSDFSMNVNIDPVLIDYDFFLNAGLLKSTKFYLIEKPLIQFRVHGNQLSHKNIVNSLKNIKFVQDMIFLKIDKNIRTKYQNALKIHSKNKTIYKKTMEFGLKLISSLLPQSTSDKILVFYLNKIRQSR